MYIYIVLTLVKYRWEATYSRWITIYSIYLTSSRYITIYSFMAIINQMVIQFYNSSLIYGLEGRFVFFLAPPSRDFWSNFLVLVWKGQVKGKPFICCYWAGARSKLYIYIVIALYLDGNGHTQYHILRSTNSRWVITCYQELIYVFTMDTELLTRYHGTPITTCRGY